MSARADFIDNSLFILPIPFVFSGKPEIMRLLPADTGQLHVFAREDAETRDEVPLSLRYGVDVSAVSPNENIEFAEYLAYSSLHVDVWDADSLLLLGACSVPLSRLMRQRYRYVTF